MKKLLALGMILGSLSFVGCSKDYSCTCSYNNGSSDSTFTVMYESASKSDAEDGCAASQVSLRVIDANATCDLD